MSSRVINDRIVQSNGVDLSVETFGRADDPAILLIHGATASMLAWEETFVQRLAAAGRFVIRYDHRDTGRSVSYPRGAPPYSQPDLMVDAIGLLDVFDLDTAHLVGRSMGGGLAMMAALEHPQRVASLTLMATTPGGPGLTPSSREFLDFIAGPPPDWSDHEALIGYYLDLLRVFNAGSPGFDQDVIEKGVRAELERTTNPASAMINHFVADPGEPIRDRLGEITAPTLVVHGANDPAFPLDHAQAIASAIPGAELVILEDAGHLFLPATWDVVVPAIIGHSAIR